VLWKVKGTIRGLRNGGCGQQAFFGLERPGLLLPGYWELAAIPVAAGILFGLKLVKRA